jgi:ParB-like chromosome segregation protein Spo0J
MVPLKEITVDHEVQVRGEVDPKRVDEYAKIIQEQGAMDAMALFTEDSGTTLLMADGFHRIQGYAKVGKEEALCKVRNGSRSEAIRYALKENGHHGAPMTNAQKRHAAEIAVADKTIGEMADKDIAAMIGCSPSLVASARKGETPKQATAKTKAKQSGKRETESAAPRSATARERKPAESPKPTKAAILKQIEEYVDRDQVDEAEVVDLFATNTAQYRFLPVDGGVTSLRIVGKNGREQALIPVVVKSLEFDKLILKFEGDGKVTVEV